MQLLPPYNRLPRRFIPATQLIPIARHPVQTCSLPQLPSPHPLLLLYMRLPLLRLHQHKKWYCLSGTIEPSPTFKASYNQWPKDTVKVSRHDYVLDTLDGGLAPVFLNLNGRSIPTWSATPQQSLQQTSFDLPHATILSLPSKSLTTLLGPKDGSYLTAKCHCSGVSLLIKRANYASNSDSSSKSSLEASARYVPSQNTSRTSAPVARADFPPAYRCRHGPLFHLPTSSTQTLPP